MFVFGGSIVEHLHSKKNWDLFSMNAEVDSCWDWEADHSGHTFFVIHP